VKLDSKPTVEREILLFSAKYRQTVLQDSYTQAGKKLL